MDRVNDVGCIISCIRSVLLSLCGGSMWEHGPVLRELYLRRWKSISGVRMPATSESEQGKAYAPNVVPFYLRSGRAGNLVHFSRIDTDAGLFCFCCSGGMFLYGLGCHPRPLTEKNRRTVILSTAIETETASEEDDVTRIPAKKLDVSCRVSECSCGLLG